MKKVKVGLRLFFAGLALLIGVLIDDKISGFLLAGICMSFPAMKFVPGFLRTGDGDPDTEKLLKSIKDQTEKFYKEKGFMTKEEIDKVVSEKMKAFEGIEASKLKEFFDEKTGVYAQIKSLQETNKAQGIEINSLKEKGTIGSKVTFKTVLDSVKDKLKALFDEAKGSGDTDSKWITIDVKAAAIMTTGNTVTGHAALPDDLIESFSERGFVAKRQAPEWVYDLANVITVGSVEKYITWLEEGSVQGSFAIVAEGGLK